MQNNKRETQSEKLASITLAFSFTQQKLTFRDLGVPKKKSALSAVLKSIPTFPTPKKEHQDIQDTLKGVQWCVTVCTATIFQLNSTLLCKSPETLVNRSFKAL